MAEKLQNEATLSRDEVAENLEQLAEEIRNGTGNFRVGNKTVELTPSEQVTYEIGVHERTSLLRSNRETVTVKLEWKP